MKVIDKIEIGYVVPETAAEQAEIEAIIKNFEADKNGKIDLPNFKKTPASPSSDHGFWRLKKKN